jgi:hypothetical protein
VTNVITVYIHSSTLQLLMNVVVHVEAFKSGLVSRVRDSAHTDFLAGAALPPSHISIKGNYYKSGPSQGDILHDEPWTYKLVWYSGYIADFLIVTKGLGFKCGSSTFFICTK